MVIKPNFGKNHNRRNFYDTKRKNRNHPCPIRSNEPPGIERLHGIELTAALLLQSHLFGMEPSERQEVMCRIVRISERTIDRNTLVTVLNGIKKATASEMDEWLEIPCANTSLTHHTQKARNELAAKNFALLKNGVSQVLTGFLLDLCK